MHIQTVKYISISLCLLGFSLFLGFRPIETEPNPDRKFERKQELPAIASPKALGHNILREPLGFGQSDNLRVVPTTLDWRRSEAPAEGEKFDFFKLMGEPLLVPDSVLHDLRVLGSMSSCYEPKDNAKNEMIFPNGLEYAACQILDLITPDEFMVYDYAMFPNLLEADRGQGHELAFESMKERVSNGYSRPEGDRRLGDAFYLLLGTQVNPEDQTIVFKVAVHLPNTGDFSEVNSSVEEFIALELKAEMEGTQTDVGGILAITDAEIAAMERFKQILLELKSDSYSTNLTQMRLLGMGFCEVATDSAPDFSRTGNYVESTNVKDFAGLSGFVSAAEDASANNPYKSIIGAVGVIISDNITNTVVYEDPVTHDKNTGFEWAGLNFKSMPHKFKVWIHYYNPQLGDIDFGVKKMYYKWDWSSSYTEEDADSIIEMAYAEYYNSLGYENAKPDREEKTESRLSDCVWPDSWKWRMKPNITSSSCISSLLPTCGDPGPGNNGPNPFCWVFTTQRDYYAGAVCGFVDGFLDLAGGIHSLAEGLNTILSHVPGSPAWFLDALKKCVQEGSFWKGIQHKLKDDAKYWKSAYEAAKALVGLLISDNVLYDFFRTIYSAFGMIVKGVEDGLKDLFFYNGAINAGYGAGKLIFEVVMTFLTAGANKVSSIGSSLLKTFQTSMKNGVAGMKNIFKTSWGASDEAAKLVAKCRLGCFVAGTLVHTAAGPAKLIDVNHQIFSNDRGNLSINPEYEFVAANKKGGIPFTILSATNDDEIPSNNIETEEITPETWRWIKAAIFDESGEIDLTVHLRRPIWWLHENKIHKIGDQTWLSFPEMGVSGNATVLDFYKSLVDTRKTLPEPENKSYIYRPITGFFERKATEVWDYVFSTGDTLSATPNHPFYSVNRSQYVPIGDFKLGESVTTINYTDSRLVSKSLRTAGAHKVYNIEVWRDHNYSVGKEGVLVHNDCASKIANLLEYKKWKRTHPPDTQDDAEIQYFVERLQAGDVYDFYRDPIVTTTFEGKTYLIEGHHRIEAAKRVNFANLNYTEILPTPEALSTYTRYKDIQAVIEDAF